MEIVVELVFKTYDDEEEFLDKRGNIINPVDYLNETFGDLPRDYVNFDVYINRIHHRE